jgi:hypothetical protein
VRLDVLRQVPQVEDLAMSASSSVTAQLLTAPVIDADDIDTTIALTEISNALSECSRIESGHDRT